MPYVIKHKRRYIDEEFGVEKDRSETLSRYAVKTLEEAQCKAWVEGARGVAKLSDRIKIERDAKALPESGGTIELPDGTMIEVRPTD